MNRIAKFLIANITEELQKEIIHSAGIFDKSQRLKEIIQSGITQSKIEDYQKEHPEDKYILERLKKYADKKDNTISKQDIINNHLDLERVLNISAIKTKRLKKILPLYILENKPESQKYQLWLKQKNLI